MRLALAALALLAMIEGAAAEAPMPLERTHPDQLREPFRDPITPQYIPPRVPVVRSQAVYSLPDGLAKLAEPDETLSELCRRGAFVQEVDGYYWARTKNRRYGVAFSSGHNLIDLQNRRKPGRVYFFDKQDSFCTVYVGRQSRLMKHYIGP